MKKWLSWGVPAVALLALVGWRFSVNKANEAQSGQQQGQRRNAAASVEVATAAGRIIVESIQSVGNLESPFKVEVSPKTTGRISFLEVREGDPVTAGQVLLKIDPSDLQGAVVQAQANVAEARSRLAQAKITQGATNVGVTSQIKQQSAGVESAKADLDQVQRNYEAQIQAAQSQVNAASSAVNNAQAGLDKENANLRNAQVKYDRTYDLYKKAYIAAQDLDDAKTALEVQKGAVGVAKAQLDAARSQLNVQQQNLSIVKRKGTSDIADSQAKLTQAKAILDVANANRSQTPAYQENISALQSSVDAAMAGLKQAQARLSDTVVRSSINGTATARKADPGALASPGSPVLEVQFLDWLYVTTTIPIESGSAVHEGQMAEIAFDALPGQAFSGPVVNLNPAADPASRQFGIRVRLDNPDHRLRPGMYARIKITTGKTNAAAVVPLEAVKTDSQGASTVTVVDSGNVAHVRTVTLGARDDKGVQIIDGVGPGEKVVVLTYTPVRDGQKVTTGKPGAGAAQGGGRRGRGDGQGRSGRSAPGGGGQ